MTNDDECDNIKKVQIANEKETKTCTNCGELKIRVLKGKYNKKDKRWKGVEGGYWNGHVCPDCHRKKCAERMRIKRGTKI